MKIKNLASAVQKKHLQKIRFVVSGSMVAVIGISVLYIFTDYFHIWYLLSSTIAFFVALIVNFFMQKIWTFQDKRNMSHKQVSLFFANSLLNLVLNTALMYGMVDVLEVHHILSQMFVMIVLAIMNYTIYRLYIFQTPEYNTVDTI